MALSIIDQEAVAKQLGLIDADKKRFEAICDAVHALVAAWVPPTQHNSAAVKLGAEMLAARLWRRRQSSTGVETLGDIGTIYVARYDPDIAQLLGIGSYAPPSVG